MRHGGPIRRARFVVLASLFAVAVMLGATATAGARPHGQSTKPKATVKLAEKWKSQAKLIAAGNVKVKAKATKHRKVLLKVVAHQGGNATRITDRARVWLRVQGGAERPHAKSPRLPLTEIGSGIVQSCIATKLEAVAKTKQGGLTLARSKAKLARDPALCDGSTPRGVDFSTADRCDFITEPGSECLFPYPNDYFTRKDAGTDTGLRLNLQEASTPQNNKGKHVDPGPINTSDGFSPGAPIVIHIPGMDTPQAFANTGAAPITHMGSYADPAQPIVLIDAANRAATADLVGARRQRDQPRRNRSADPPGRQPPRRPPLHRRAAQPEGFRRRDDPGAGRLPAISRPDPDEHRRWSSSAALTTRSCSGR